MHDSTRARNSVGKITVLITGKQAFLKTELHQVLSQQSDFQVLDCSPSKDLLELIEAKLPDITLLGTDLALSRRLALSRKITQNYPNTKVIILCSDPDDEELFEVMKTAAVACFNQSSTAEELVSTIRRAHRGEYPINDSLMTRLGVARLVSKQFQEITSMGKAIANIMTPLTHLETQILLCITNGIAGKHIAHTLRFSEQVVKTHVSSILRKLIAADRVLAVTLAMNAGRK